MIQSPIKLPKSESRHVLTIFSFPLKTSWVIPHGTPSGLYAIEVVNGTEAGEPIFLGELPNPKTTTPSATPSRSTARGAEALLKRWDEPDCYPAEGLQDLDHRTTDIAIFELSEQCLIGYAVKSEHSLYTVSECVVSYFCHLRQDPDIYEYILCDNSALVWAMGAIDAKCGRYKPGQVQTLALGDNGEHVSVAYGRESYCTPDGHNFCGHGADLL